MNNIKLLQKMIDESNNIVFFGGAGVSTSSGIKDFRGKDGLYSKKYKLSIEYLLSFDCFYSYPEIFFEFYKQNMNFLNYEPNIIHKYLKKLEDKGKLKAIITQNIDGLHNKALSKNVYEIHGTIYNNHCIKCGKSYSAEYIFSSNSVPLCSCGSLIKPDVVLYGEMLPIEFIKSQELISKADMLIVAGTSLTVEPAASLVNIFNGKNLVIINYDKTSYDSKANLVINHDMKEIFSKLKV